MLHMSMQPIHAMPTGAHLIVAAVRSWHDARRRNIPVQPHLYSALAPHDCGMLAPVLDSLIRFFESSVRRPLHVGSAEILTADEQMLVNILHGAEERAQRPASPEAHALAFKWAVWSARIMVVKVFGDALQLRARHPDRLAFG